MYAGFDLPGLNYYFFFGLVSVNLIAPHGAFRAAFTWFHCHAAGKDKGVAVPRNAYYVLAFFSRLTSSVESAVFG